MVGRSRYDSKMPRPKRRRTSKKFPRTRLKLTRAEARAYVARWELVNAHIAAERRAKTPQQRFDEWVKLMQWAKALGWRDAPRDERAVWERWNKLREALRA
jgi:hypothetical protein